MIWMLISVAHTAVAAAEGTAHKPASLEILHLLAAIGQLIEVWFCFLRCCWYQIKVSLLEKIARNTFSTR